MDPATTADLRASWGGSPQMSAWDAIMWRAEGDPRTSSMGMLVELLDSEPEWARFVTAHRTAVRQIPRLRERVVQPALPVVQPVWSPDPDFDLDHHVRCVDLGGSATRADVMAHCELIWAEPLDRARPPWQATLVNGMADGRSAYVFKVHHAMTDGMGLVQLLDLTHSSTASPTAAADDTHDDLTGSRATTTSIDLLARGLSTWAAEVPSEASAALGRLGRVLAAPWRSGEEALRYGRSLGRLLGVMPPRSPLLAGSGADNRLLLLDLDLDELKAAGRAAGGSVNDAYVAAVLGGLRIYHERYGVEVDRIPIAMPVSLRSADDPGGGNKFAGVRFSAPLAEPDPAARIRMVGEFVRDVRREPAITYLDRASPTLSKLPSAAIIELTARATAVVDMQISNIPGLRRPAYLAGARVLGTYPLGPRPGVAAMVTMMTLEGRCCIGLNVDAQAFPRLDVLEASLEAGFREVLDLAGRVEADR